MDFGVCREAGQRGTLGGDRMSVQLRCMKCASHGFYVVRNDTTNRFLEIVTTYEYECMNCEETKELEWEEL